MKNDEMRYRLVISENQARPKSNLKVEDYIIHMQNLVNFLLFFNPPPELGVLTSCGSFPSRLYEKIREVLQKRAGGGKGGREKRKMHLNMKDNARDSISEKKG